eukprot:s1280_g12.t1
MAEQKRLHGSSERLRHIVVRDVPNRGAQIDGPGGDKPGTQLAASTTATSAPVQGVPAGVPTFHLAEPALPKGVETFSICRGRADEARPVNGER